MSFATHTARAADRSNEHPAVLAYGRATSDWRPKASAEVIQRRKRSQVYRIRWAGGGSVIAKRCRHHMSAVEATVYSAVMPRLSRRVRVPAFFGCVDDDSAEPGDPFTWLFIEDLGQVRYSPHDPVQREGLARWLGSVQAAQLQAAQLQAAQPQGAQPQGAQPQAAGDLMPQLPTRDAGYYRQYLDRAIEQVPELATNRSAPPSLRRVVATVESTLQAVLAGWPGVVAAFASAPSVLVHGDCLPKNIHVLTVGRAAHGQQVVPIDWGNAGWGLPASDLGQSALLLGEPAIGAACYQAYRDALRPVWPSCDVAAVRRLAELGRLLWTVKVIAMSVPGFVYDRLEKVEQHLSSYASVLLSSSRVLRNNL